MKGIKRITNMNDMTFELLARKPIRISKTLSRC
jgi:hypothetical protein